MALARPRLARTPGLTFWKLCGSGSGEGFTPRPNTAVWAILSVWDTEAAAEAGIDGPVHAAWAARAAEHWTLRLAPQSARGRWSGAAPFAAGDDGAGPLAVLTRATVRARHVSRFWRREPAISGAIGANPDVLFKIGIGEVPFLAQVTFSVWPDAAAMARFAHHAGPHAEAVRAVREGGWFAEELYARFRVTGTTGAWSDARPLRLEDAA